MQLKPKPSAVILSNSLLLLAAFNSQNVAQAATGNPPPPTPRHYKLTIIDIPNQQFMAPWGPSLDGYACGFYNDLSGASHAFLWHDGKVTNIDAPHWAQTIATSIDDLGVVSGAVYNADGTVGTPAIYNIHKKTWTLLPPVPGLPIASNDAVNDEGTVVGAASTGAQGNVGYTWNGRSYSLFTAPGAEEGSGVGTQPLSINNLGQVTGFFADAAGTWHGFLKDHSRFTTFDVPGADYTEPFSINDEGDIVGSYYVFSPVNSEQGFILHKGQFYTIPVPGYGGVIRINDFGVISGTYADSAGIWHGFIGTPERNDHDGDDN